MSNSVSLSIRFQYRLNNFHYIKSFIFVMDSLDECRRTGSTKAYHISVFNRNRRFSSRVVQSNQLEVHSMATSRLKVSARIALYAATATGIRFASSSDITVACLPTRNGLSLAEPVSAPFQTFSLLS